MASQTFMMNLARTFASKGSLIPPNCTDCRDTCIGFDECTTCINFCEGWEERPDQYVGPGGPVVTVFMCLLPLIVLVIVTLIPKPWKSTVSLPFAALMMFVIRLAYLQAEPINVAAAVLSGMLETLTPLSIVMGAIMLFETMGHTGCMSWMMRELKQLSGGHPIAEVMLIGWAFAYLVEGASGFGTPIALAAPMLAELGHPKMEGILVLLLSNTFSALFGAVGTPVWFGLGNLNLTEDEMVEVGFKAGTTIAVLAFLLVPCMLLYLAHWRTVLHNLPFILLSLALTVIPSILVSVFNYEFATLIGGISGVAGTVLLTRFRVGLRPHTPSGTVKDLDVESQSRPSAHNVNENTPTGTTPANSVQLQTSSVHSIECPITQNPQPPAVKILESPFVETNDKKPDSGKNTQNEREIIESDDTEQGWAYAKSMLLRTFPLTLTVLLLVLTRIEPIGLKGLLRARSPALVIPLGSLGVLEISAALVCYFRDIMTDKAVTWTYETLYVPSILPFLLVSAITMFVHRKDLDVSPPTLAKEVFSRLRNPALSLMGAMVLVSLMRTGGYGSPAYLIGSLVSSWAGTWWILLSTFIGALGSFFSGSTTVSNLTFGEVQIVAADIIGVKYTTMLALQCVGAAMGNAVCMANIINARAVMNLSHIGEGEFIKRTAMVVVVAMLLGEAFVAATWIAWGN